MDSSWVVTAGSFSLYAYYVLVAALVAGIVLRRALPKLGASLFRSAGGGDRAPSVGRRAGVARFVVEYMGNLEVRAEGAAERERRRNLQARRLMDYIQQDLTRRGISPPEREHLVGTLRESLQSVEPDQAG